MSSTRCASLPAIPPHSTIPPCRRTRSTPTTARSSRARIRGSSAERSRSRSDANGTVTLPTGARFGPYEILGPLGAGGMGEVYRARDTRLSRDVAIKVLPAELSADQERLKRFEKEARSASSLNHPSIVTIYEIGQAESVSYIAMELVDGTTLRE